MGHKRDLYAASSRLPAMCCRLFSLLEAAIAFTIMISYDVVRFDALLHNFYRDFMKHIYGHVSTVYIYYIYIYIYIYLYIYIYIHTGA